VYDRRRLRAGHIIRGPAIVIEMDSTTVVLPSHAAKVDSLGNLLINPV
jgi:N-methylhydantoinase A